MTGADVDQAQREAWRRAAEGWERHQEELRERTSVVSDWMVDAVDPQSGERVLEIAAGPGETGFLAARRVGTDGLLVTSDQSPEMIEVAKRRAAELGLENVRFELIDAQELDLDPDSFDAALCRWGYMLMGDPDRALQNTRRVLRPGGRLALATWDTPDRNMWMAAPVIAMVGAGAMPPPEPAAPNPFKMADPEALAQRLRAAGFESVRTDKIEFSQLYDSFDRYWEITLDMAAPIQAAIRALDHDRTEEIRENVRGTLAPFAGEDGSIEVPSSAVVAAATA